MAREQHQTPITPLKQLTDRLTDQLAGKIAHSLLMEEIADGWLGYGCHHVTEVVETFEGVIIIMPLYNDRKEHRPDVQNQRVY